MGELTVFAAIIHVGAVHTPDRQQLYTQLK